MMPAVGEIRQPRDGAGERRPPPKLDVAGLREALRAADRTEGASPRRVVLVAALLLAVAAALALVGRSLLRRSPESVAREASEDLARLEARNWSSTQVLSPSAVRRDPATGEVTSPFQGFAVSVDSSPAGARVLLDGSEMGEAPLTASYDCEPGREVEVRVEKAGHRPLRRMVRCRADTLLHLEVRLAKGAADPP